MPEVNDGLPAHPDDAEPGWSEDPVVPVEYLHGTTFGTVRIEIPRALAACVPDLGAKLWETIRATIP